MPDVQGDGVVLGLDTCGAEASLMLARLTASSVEPMGGTVLPARTAGAFLTSTLRDLLAVANLKPADLRAVAVVRGPGSFTGMRIGLSAAKALSEAAEVPLVAVSRLAVFAAVTKASCVALDAGRGNLYLRMERKQASDEGSAEAGSLASLRLAQNDTDDTGGMGSAGGADRTKDRNSKGGTGIELIVKNVVNADEQLLTPVEFEHLLLEPSKKPLKLMVCEMKLHARYPAAQLCPAPTAFDALCFAHSRIVAGDWDDTATVDALYLWRAEQMLNPPRSFMNTMAVRPMLRQDIPWVAAIAAVVPTAPHWPAVEYDRMLKVIAASPGKRGAWVATSGGQVHGFAMATHVGGTAELEAVVTAPAHRRQGAGSMLLREVVAWSAGQGATRLLLEARASNRDALTLYARLGFREDGVRRGYYRNPDEDAVLLSLPLHGSVSEPVSPL